MYSDEKKKKSVAAIVLITIFVVTILVVGIIFAILMATRGAIAGQTNSEENTSAEYEISNFNQKFTRYEGTSVNGSNVKILISMANSTNAVNSGEKVIITTIDTNTKQEQVFTFAQADDSTNLSMLVESLNTYMVECVVDDDTKYVSEVRITGEFAAAKTEFETLNDEILSIKSEIMGDELNTLIDKIIESNVNSQNDNKMGVKIITQAGAVVEISEEEAINRDKIGTAPDNRRYLVTTTIDANTGYISLLTITDLGE